MHNTLLKTLSLSALLSLGLISSTVFAVKSQSASSSANIQVIARAKATTPKATKSNDTSLINTQNGIAIKGTDPVAYFTQGKPVRGSSSFSYSWNGATWHFASAANRDLFAQNPTQYAPQYGGYCAWAVSQGYLADIDPNAWKIVDGKLYLNVSLSIHRRWEQDIAGNIAKANSNWPNIAQSRS